MRTFKYVVTTMKFIWDENKAWSNYAKHGISFELVTTAFEDPLHLSKKEVENYEKGI